MICKENRMQKRILFIRVLAVLMLTMTSSPLWAAPPADNTVPPCDNAPDAQKPPCSMDSESVNAPPEMPHGHGVIVPPEVPAEGYPNQEKRQRQPVQKTPNQQDKQLKH